MEGDEISAEAEMCEGLGHVSQKRGNVRTNMGRRKCVSAAVTHVSEDTSTSSDKEAVQANQGTLALYRGHPQKVGELLKF